MHPVIAIVGPTASGKSDLGLDLAEHFKGEIVNYDSIQIFRYLDIGSAKPSVDERERVPHHMIDIRDPIEAFSAGDYQREARLVLDDIASRKNTPILVGGTGLYLRALTDGLFNGPHRSASLRERLELIAEKRGREHLHRLLGRLDPDAAVRIMPRDKPKIIRAIEVRLETGKALSAHLQENPRDPLKGYEVHFIGLNPPRDELYKRIDERVVRMFQAGLVDEVRQMLARGIPKTAKPFEAIGYRHVLSYLESNNRQDETISIIQRETRRYAKRQLTWFRRQSSVKWFDGPGDTDDTKKMVRQFAATTLTF